MTPTVDPALVEAEKQCTEAQNTPVVTREQLEDWKAREVDIIDCLKIGDGPYRADRPSLANYDGDDLNLLIPNTPLPSTCSDDEYSGGSQRRWVVEGEVYTMRVASCDPGVVTDPTN